MNTVYVVATAKHTLNLRGKQYKIGEPIPTELTEKEYNFYKDALNVESVKEVKQFENGGIHENNGALFVNRSRQPEFITETKTSINIVDYEKLKEAFENAIKERDELKERLSEIELNLSTSEPTETEVKPKKPSGRPKKDS